MSEKPILFLGPEVRAILEGRKTQTRRIVKGCVEEPGTYSEEAWMRGYMPQCPYGSIGAHLWVRETWALNWATKDYESGHYDDWGNVTKSRLQEVKSKDDLQHHEHVAYAADDGWEPNKDDRAFNWKPSIHMPRWASRIMLEITGVRVEQLQEISEDDAKAEGAEPMFQHGNGAGFQPLPPGAIRSHASAYTCRNGFWYLWEQINGASSWAANPYVWVIEFRRVA